MALSFVEAEEIAASVANRCKQREPVDTLLLIRRVKIELYQLEQNEYARVKRLASERRNGSEERAE